MCVGVFVLWVCVRVCIKYVKSRVGNKSKKGKTVCSPSLSPSFSLSLFRFSCRLSEPAYHTNIKKPSLALLSSLLSFLPPALSLPPSLPPLSKKSERVYRQQVSMSMPVTT